MTPIQSEILASIQRLTLTGPTQTGLRFIHEVRADDHARGSYIVSEVIVYKQAAERLEPALRLTTQVEQDGTDEPTGLEQEERTLAGQRDELAAFIAANRKEEAAA